MSALCPTCNQVLEYPFCVDKFHDHPRPNPVVDNLVALHDQIGRWAGGR
jgi:hypothetical protein